MDISLKKIALIQWLSQVQDEQLINKIESLKDQSEKDWWDSLTNDQKEDIESGLTDLDAGRKSDFHKVISKYH